MSILLRDRPYSVPASKPDNSKVVITGSGVISSRAEEVLFLSEYAVDITSAPAWFSNETRRDLCFNDIYNLCEFVLTEGFVPNLVIISEESKKFLRKRRKVRKR
jgi:hypothetical protein